MAKRVRACSSTFKLCVVGLVCLLLGQATVLLDVETSFFLEATQSTNNEALSTPKGRPGYRVDKEMVLGPAAHRAKYFGFENRESNQGHRRSDWDRLTISECNAQGVDEFLTLREIQIQNLPQAILIGVQKGGTTALHSYLSKHPDVEMMEKELYLLDETLDYYFLDPSNEPSIPRKRGRELYSQQTLGITQEWNQLHTIGGPSRPIERMKRDRTGRAYNSGQYLKLHTTKAKQDKNSNRNIPSSRMPTPDDSMEVMFQSRRANRTVFKMAVDMTPNYMLHSDRVPARIRCLVPWVKIFVMLRHPIERAKSQYDMKLRILPERGANSRPSVGRGRMFNNNKQKKKKDEDPLLLVNPWGNPIRSFDQFVRDDLDALYEVGVLQNWTKVNFEDFWNSDECWKAWQAYIHLGLNAPIGMGLYALQLKPFLDMLQTIHGKNLSMDKFLAIDNRDLKTDTNGTFQTLLQFLNLRPFSLDQYKTVNSGGGKRVVNKPIYELSKETEHNVLSAIEPYNNKLADILGEEWRNKWS
eukprot:scaffold13560_cov161-Cylindrotheca_fusiformis.AAC.3